MSSWLKIGAEWIKTLTGQWNDASDLNVPGKANDSSAVEDSETVADRMMAQLESQRSIKTEASPRNQQGFGQHDLAARADSIAAQAESQISIKAEDSPNEQELGRRREIVRQFFNDFWSSSDDKPRSFAERLNWAEGYINERLAACGEAWQLDPATRKKLGLPP